MVFLAIHVLTSVLDTYVHVGWASILVPFASPYRPLWTGLGTVAVDLMMAVAISSALRQRISARTWRGIHWLAYGSWPVAMAHSLGEGTDATKLWMDALAAACALAVVGALAWRIADARRAEEQAPGSAPPPGPCPALRLGPTVGPRRPVSGTGPATIPPVPAGRPSATRLLEKDRP